MSESAPFPLTPLQEAYLVGASPMMELGGFFPTYYVELEALDLDLDRASSALQQVIHRHEHLRTVVDGTGSQHVLPKEHAAAVPLAVHDVTGLEEGQQDAAVHRTRDRMCRTGVDPTTWPLVQIAVTRRCARRVHVHIAMSLLLLDGRSIHQVIDEWRAFYHDLDADLPAAALTYRQCRLLLLEHESTSRYQEQWRYWQDRLDHLPEAPHLPLVGRPATGQDVRFTRKICSLTREQWTALCRGFRAHRVLPATGLCHLFAEVLGAWAADPRFTVNLLHQNWAFGRPQMHGVVGQFGATLPLEVDLRQSEDFWERGRRLQRQMFTDLQHSDVSGVRITRELAARRGWSSRAVSPYVFTSTLRGGGSEGAHDHRSDEGPGLRRIHFREVFSELRTPQVLVDNQLHERPDGGIDCLWDVVEGAFPPGLPDLMFTAYQRMVHNVARAPTMTDPSTRPDPIPPEHRDVVDRLNGPLRPAPQRRLEDGFLRSAAVSPGAVAVRACLRTLTYGELEARSRAVALWLIEHRVRRGDLIPVVMTKGWEQVVAVLGVLRAGAAYCPVDAGLPRARITLLLEECSAPVALIQSATAPQLEHLTVRTLAVDHVAPATTTALATQQGQPDDLAYVIHTSGSTGRPKGVMIRHRAALNTIEDISARVDLTDRDRVFGISSLSFDLSVYDMFGSLAAGASLVLPEATQHPDPLGWTHAAVRHQVTVWNSVPALARLFVEALEHLPQRAMPPLRAFLLSGDWVPTDLPQRLRRHWPQTRVLAMGGATEAAVWSNIYEVIDCDPLWRSVPYGVPLRNQSMRILDHRLELRPPWAVGQIYIGGAGLADGYWRDATRTDERFVQHPRTGERLYATGDQGCYWPDGTIEFLGRQDRQLKIQGFRVEPGEVEAAIREHPRVRDCAVVGVGAAGQHRRLVAFVVPQHTSTAVDDDTALEAAEILTRLRARLPHYLVPGRLHVLERLPLTSNGKVDVTLALAAQASQRADSPPNHDRTQGANAVQEPDGALVQQLRAVWAELLGTANVEADADFFALGGNSLLVLRLVHRLHVELGLELPFGQIFETPTPRSLAARIAGPVTSSGCRVTLADGRPAGRGHRDSAAAGRDLVLFHPVGGSVSSCAALARHWPGPVQAFQSRALAGAPEGDGVEQYGPAQLHPDLVTMAGAYRAELQASADGPYLLGGWSMGGVLAHEVGRQLVEHGERAQVFMVDSDLSESRRTRTLADQHLEFLTDLAAGQLPLQARTIVLQAPSQQLTRVAADVAIKHGWLPEQTQEHQYEVLRQAHAYHLRILNSYRPGPSAAPTLLLVAGLVERPDPVPAWGALCPDLQWEIWAEDHYTIVAAERPAAIIDRVISWMGEAGRPNIQQDAAEAHGPTSNVREQS